MNKNCIYCKNKNCVIKKRKTKAGSQRYFCKNCGKTFILKSNGRNYDEEFKKNAIRLYFKGNSSRTVVEF